VRGYYVVIQKSRKGKVWLKCDRGGTPKERDAPRQRDTDTRLNGCPFAVVIRLFTKEGVWKFTKSTITIPTFDRAGSSVGRRLESAERARVMQFAREGAEVKNVLNNHRSEFKNTWTTSKDIHNFL
jgi:hypothetical protein